MLDHSLDGLRIDSIASRLDPDERLLRRALIEQIIALGRPVHPGELPANVIPGPTDLEPLSRRLVDKRSAVRDASGGFQFVYPVSALPTPHRVELADGRSFHAMCAVDALGAAFTLGQDAGITSRCCSCATSLSVRVVSGEIAEPCPQQVRVLHVDLNRSDLWATNC